jgi:arylsulfatase A-like enzyme
MSLPSSRLVRTRLLLALAGAACCLPASAQTPPAPGNVLVLVADDLGVDKVSCYQPGTTPPCPSTPNIDVLAANGVRFLRAYANPLCSPTRACIQTGRYGFRTGIGTNVRSNDPNTLLGPLSLTEILLPEMLDNAGSGYAHAAIGKWHLGYHKSLGVLGDPLNGGWGHFSGAKGNFETRTLVPQHYENWSKTVDGYTFTTTHYATADNVDDALAWIALQGSQPWLCYVAFNAPHTPVQRPPGSHLPNYVPVPGEPWWPYHNAMIEDLDTEIDRLLRGIENFDPLVYGHTTVFFLGDNGTSSAPSGAQQLVFPPFDSSHCKGSLYEGGIHVPLIVSGYRVDQPGRLASDLVSAVDLFATIAGLAGVDLTQPTVIPPGVHIDSVSFLPLLEDAAAFGQRQNVFAETFVRNNPPPGVPTLADRCLLGPRYKFMRLETHDPPDNRKFFDLLNDPWETDDLLQHASGLDPSEQAELDTLERAMDDLLKLP